MRSDLFLAILRRARAGDHDSWRVLVEEFLGYVFRLASRLTGSVPDAEDIALETFVRAYFGLADFRGGTAGEFASWLASICNRCWADEARKSGRRKGIASERSLDAPVPTGRAFHSSSRTLADLVPDPRAAPSLEWIEAVDFLRAVLTPPELCVYVLRMHGYSREEVGSILGEEPRRIKYWHERARKKLGSVREEWW